MGPGRGRSLVAIAEIRQCWKLDSAAAAKVGWLRHKSNGARTIRGATRESSRAPRQARVPGQAWTLRQERAPESAGPCLPSEAPPASGESVRQSTGAGRRWDLSRIAESLRWTARSRAACRG